MQTPRGMMLSGGALWRARSTSHILLVIERDQIVVLSQRPRRSRWYACPVCYSAQIRASYKRYVRAWGADISIKQFVRMYWLRNQGAKIKIPKAVDAGFAELDQARRSLARIESVG